MENKAEQVLEAKQVLKELQDSNSKLHEIFDKDRENFKEFRDWLVDGGVSDTVLNIIDDIIDKHHEKTKSVFLKPSEASQAIEISKFLYDIMKHVYAYDYYEEGLYND